MNKIVTRTVVRVGLAITILGGGAGLIAAMRSADTRTETDLSQAGTPSTTLCSWESESSDCRTYSTLEYSTPEEIAQRKLDDANAPPFTGYESPSDPYDPANSIPDDGSTVVCDPTQSDFAGANCYLVFPSTTVPPTTPP